MNIINIFIGEVFKKEENSVKRIGYQAVMYSSHDNMFHSLDLYLTFDTDPNCSFIGPYYIDSHSLIAYTSFMAGNLVQDKNVIIFECRQKIKELEDERLNKLYLNYTEEEKNKIHERGFITIDEKADECISMRLCAPGDAATIQKVRCNTFTNCRECLIDFYAKQGERAFKKFDYGMKK